MFKYRFLRTHIQDFTAHAAHVHNADIEATTILSITLPCVSVLLFNAEYFVILFWPGQTYTRGYLRAKRGVFVAATAAALATVIASTIIVATRSASITGVDEATVQQLTALYFRPPLQYNTWPQNIAWVVLLWITVVLNIISTILLLKATQREERTMTTAPADDSMPSPSAGVIVVEKDSESEIKEKSIISARTEEVSV
ncbi:hypothetical protein BDN70DRAFT_881900 [Pholiota conissans]|uniref:Transmembrane protein n=1 Tax=Pholiota conissans TaxID=109636 RepID=A0A9P5YXE1_9AGAR|nr:hypothetical protein BDN70DRAFT_881900 [Pholiota conissans]